MAPRKKKTDERRYTLEEVLVLTNEELLGNWSTLTSFIREVENIHWNEAQKKALAFFKDKPAAIEYIEAAKAGKITQTKTSEQVDTESTPEKIETILESESKNINEKTSIQKKPSGRDRYSQNYKRLLKLIPDLEKRLLDGEEIWGKSKESPYTPLNIELTHQNDSSYYLAMSHNYIQNGDLVPNPEMVIRFDTKEKVVEALSFNKASVYQEVYDNIYNPISVKPKLQQYLNDFLEEWLLRLINQKHEIEWKHIKTKSIPKRRNSGSNSGSIPLEAPDISYMDESVIDGIRTYYNRLMLDTALNKYFDHVDGKSPMRPIARYFVVQRADNAPLINSPKLKYPTDEELRKDYEELLEFQKQNRRVESQTDIVSDENTSEQKSTDMNEKELEETVKHWKKLAKAIREIEPELSTEESEQKARQLKSDGKALEYLIDGMQGSNRKQIAELKKANYQKLMRLIPDLNERIANDSLMGKLMGSSDSDLHYSIEPATEVSKTTKQFAIQNEAKSGTLIIAVMKVRKQTFVTTHADNLLKADSYLWNTSGFTANDTYHVNLRFGQWLDKMIKETDGVQWQDRNNGNSEPEQLLKVEDFHFFKVGDLVTRHKSGDDDKTIYRVRKLEKFDSNDTELKVTIEDSLGVVDELIEQDYLKLVLSAGDYDPKNFDWKNKTLGEMPKPEKKTEPTSEVKDDYEQTQQKVQYDPTGSKEEVERLLKKYPIVYEFSEVHGYINRGYKTLDGAKKALVKYGMNEGEENEMTTNVFWFKGDDSAFVIPVSAMKKAYNPKADDLGDFLRNNYESRLDWSYFTSRLPRIKRNSSKQTKKQLEKAKQDAATIPVFEVGKVKLTEQHKRAGITQKDIDWINKNRQGMVLTPRKNMVNHTRDFKADKQNRAKLPGKRISATGRIYYEGRSNRSDLGKDGL